MVAISEDELARAHGRFRELFDAAPCGYYTVDPRRGRIQESNRTLQRLLGYSAAELGTMTQASLFAEGEGEADVAASLLETARAGQRIEDHEVRLRHKSGEPIWVSTSVTPLFDELGDLAELRSTVVDIRDRKREEGERELLEVQFREAQKLETLGLLAGGVAHDFNNILMTIMGNAEMVVATLPAEDPRAGYLAEIQHASHQAAELCRQMLQYCGKGKTEVRALHLSQLVSEIADLLRVSLPAKVHLDLRLGRLLGAVVGDVKQLQQVVVNLVTNAGEAIGQKRGTVRLRTGKTSLGEAFLRGVLKARNLAPGEFLFLEVTDDGVGMDEETLARIYDPFFSTKFTGRGLGMAAVSGIVRGHAGAIQVESELGEGSVFRVFLPAIPDRQPSTAGQEMPGEMPTVQGGLILLADDETPVLNLTRRMLEHLGYEVVAGHDGSDALELYEQHQDALVGVILDLVMPGMGGEEVLAEIRRRDQELPIIISSGYTEQEISGLLANDPRLGFLQKPYSLATLTTKLQSFQGADPPLPGSV